MSWDIKKIAGVLLSKQGQGADQQPWLKQQLLAEHFAVVPASAGANLLNAATVMAVFWYTMPLALIALSASLFLTIIARRFAILKWFRSMPSEAPTEIANVRKSLFWNALALGGWWGATVFVLSLFASPQQMLFLMVLGAGMTAAGAITFRTDTASAKAFILTVAGGSALMLIHMGHAIAMASLFLLATFVAILLVNVYQTYGRAVERLLHNQELAQSSETINLLLTDFTEHGSDWLLELDSCGRLVNPSAKFADALGIDHGKLNQMVFAAILQDGPEKAAILEHIANGRPFRNHAVQVLSEGAETWWSISARAVNSGGVVFRGVITDITAQRAAEQQVTYMAHFDALTGLPNRFQFQRTLSRMVDAGAKMTLMYLDLDEFKGVNDTMGHGAGDLLLKSVAERLQMCLEQDEFAARLGGDEFAIILPGNCKARIKLLCADLFQSFAMPFPLDGQDAVIGTSIGIAIYPQHGSDASTLLSSADLALYDAKARGKNCSAMFEPGMDTALQNRRILERDLKTALAHNELSLHYQSLVTIETGAVTGYEALIRWEHPERGMVMPMDFIPIAEETGLIVPIGEWVIRKAIEDLASWPGHLTVSINLSVAQMRSPSLISTLVFALAKSQVDPARICLEITETVLMQDTAGCLETLHKIRDLGVQIALDDFGTGYSSLNYLRSFPFSRIKIDRCFVNEIDQSEESQAIVRSVVGLANSLGMQITAEGVERNDQADRLRSEGCREAQGWLYAKALPHHELAGVKDLVQKTGSNNIAHLAAKPQAGENVGKKSVQRKAG